MATHLYKIYLQKSNPPSRPCNHPFFRDEIKHQEEDRTTEKVLGRNLLRIELES